MKRLLGLGTAAALVLGAGAASAAPLNWSGTLSSSFGNALPVLAETGGGVATVNGASPTIPAHLGTFKLAASRGQVTGTTTGLVTDPQTIGNGIAAVKIQFRPGTGTIGPISGAVKTGPAMTKRKMPIGGVAKLCLLSTTCNDFLPLLLTQPTTNGARYQVNTATANQLTPNHLQGKKLKVPGTGVKGVGVGGLITVGGFSAIRVSVEAAPWTVKTASAIDQTAPGTMGFVTVTRRGFAHGPASATTSTAQPSGVVQIVTPSQIRTNLALGTNKKIGSITTLIVHFVPEPGMLLLLGSGVVGLALLGRNRMRK
jgi:hypothetical protein